MKILKTTLLAVLRGFLFAWLVVYKTGLEPFLFSFVTCTIFCFIILYDNRMEEYNFFRDYKTHVKASWRTRTDTFFVVLFYLLALVLMFIAFRIIYETDKNLTLLYNLIALICAFPIRYFSLRHAPEDIDAYIENNKPNEDKENEFITVGWFDDAAKAHEVKDKLDAMGIETILYGENAPAHLGSTRQSPILVRVRLKDRKEAERLMKDLWRNSE